MYLPMVILLLAGLMVLQLILCFGRGKRRRARYLPVVMTALADAACWILYFINYHSPVYGAAMAFFVFGVVLLLALAGELLVWVLYAVVKYIQKGKK